MVACSFVGLEVFKGWGCGTYGTTDYHQGVVVTYFKTDALSQNGWVWVLKIKISDYGDWLLYLTGFADFILTS